MPISLWHIHILEKYSDLKRKGKPAIFNNMVGPGEYYAK